MPSLAIVIPARNEGQRLGEVLSAILAPIPGIADMVCVVVDDGSRDDTAEVARKAGAVVLRHRVNLGKGGALLTGCEASIRLRADLIVTMDGDGQHEPKDLPGLLAPLLDGSADVALGARRLAGEMPVTARLGNWLLTALIRLLFRISITDTQCGLRAFRAAVFPALRWEAMDYAVESEMLIRMARAHLRYVEVPITTRYHDRYKGTQPMDGLRILRDLIRWRLRSLA